MKLNCIKISLAFLLCYLLSSCSESQIAGGTTDTETGPPLIGRLLDSLDQPLTHKTIRLYHSSNSPWDSSMASSTTTDSMGYFKFETQKEESYRLVASDQVKGISQIVKSGDSNVILREQKYKPVKFYFVDSIDVQIGLAGSNFIFPLKLVKEGEIFTAIVNQIPFGTYNIFAKISDNIINLESTLEHLNSVDTTKVYMEISGKVLPVDFNMYVSKDDIRLLKGQVLFKTQFDQMMYEARKIILKNKLDENGSYVGLWPRIYKADSSLTSVTQYTTAYIDTSYRNIVLDPQNFMPSYVNYNGKTKTIRLLKNDQGEFFSSERTLRLANLIATSFGAVPLELEEVANNQVNKINFSAPASLMNLKNQNQIIDSLNLKVMSANLRMQNSSEIATQYIQFIPQKFAFIMQDSLGNPIKNSSFNIYGVSSGGYLGTSIISSLKSDSLGRCTWNSPDYQNHRNFLITLSSNNLKYNWLPLSTYWIRNPKISQTQEVNLKF